VGNLFLKILIFIYLLLCLFNVSYSSFTNFDFSLQKYLVLENTETAVYFSYLLSGYENKDFVIKPFIGSGAVEIFNSEKKEWKGALSSTNLLPQISENMLIRIQNLNVDKTYLWFEIECLRDGKLYITPKKVIWSEKIYDGYVEEINYSMSNYKEINSDKTNEILEVTETSESSQNSYFGLVEKISRRIYLYLSMGLFFSAAVVGFLFKRPENKREMIQSISEDIKKLGTCSINDASYLRSFFNSWGRNKAIDSWE